MLTCKSRSKAYYNDTVVVILAISKMQTLPQGTDVWLCISLHKNSQNRWVKRNQELLFTEENPHLNDNNVFQTIYLDE